MDDIREITGYGVLSDKTSDGVRTIKLDITDSFLTADEIRPIVMHPQFVMLEIDRNGALCLHFNI